ncbi:MAG: lipid A biosynthesis acyltransferase, partial [Nitrospirae bacterium]
LSDEAVRENTRRMSAYVEEYIRENPSEWLWIHRRWKRA